MNEYIAPWIFASNLPKILPFWWSPIFAFRSPMIMVILPRFVVRNAWGAFTWIMFRFCGRSAVLYEHSTVDKKYKSQNSLHDAWCHPYCNTALVLVFLSSRIIDVTVFYFLNAGTWPLDFAESYNDDIHSAPFHFNIC